MGQISNQTRLARRRQRRGGGWERAGLPLGAPARFQSRAIDAAPASSWRRHYLLCVVCGCAGAVLSLSRSGNVSLSKRGPSKHHCVRAAAKICMARVTRSKINTRSCVRVNGELRESHNGPRGAAPASWQTVRDFGIYLCRSVWWHNKVDQVSTLDLEFNANFWHFLLAAALWVLTFMAPLTHTAQMDC